MAKIEALSADHEPMWSSSTMTVLPRFCVIEELAVRLGLPLEFLQLEAHAGRLTVLDLRRRYPDMSCSWKPKWRYYDVDACEAALIQDRSDATRSPRKDHIDDIVGRSLL